MTSHRIVLDVSGLPTASVGRDAAGLLDAVAQAHLLFCPPPPPAGGATRQQDIGAPNGGGARAAAATFAVADLRTDKPLEAHLRSITERRRAALRE